MNSPFGNNRGLGRTPRRPDRLQGAALQGPRRNHWRSAALGHLGRGLRRPKQRQPRPAFEHAIEQLQCCAVRGTQYARRPLLIRKVTTTPSGDQSNAIAPPSCAATVRCTNLLPKPSSVDGATTVDRPVRSTSRRLRRRERRMTHPVCHGRLKGRRILPSSLPIHE
jgi:hypothetical protein